MGCCTDVFCFPCKILESVVDFLLVCLCCPCRCCCGCPKTSTEHPDRVVLIQQGPPVYYVPPTVQQQPSYR